MTSDEYEKLTVDIIEKFKSHIGNNNISIKSGKKKQMERSLYP